MLSYWYYWTPICFDTPSDSALATIYFGWFMAFSLKNIRYSFHRYDFCPNSYFRISLIFMIVSKNWGHEMQMVFRSDFLPWFRICVFFGLNGCVSRYQITLFSFYVPHLLFSGYLHLLHRIAKTALFIPLDYDSLVPRTFRCTWDLVYRKFL